MSEPKKHSILDELLADVPEDVNVFVHLISDLAEQVKADMLTQGLTRRALAQRLGKSESEITKWLSGLHNLTLNSVAKLSAALQMDLLVTRDRAQGYFGRQAIARLPAEVGTGPVGLPAEVAAVQTPQRLAKPDPTVNGMMAKILQHHRSLNGLEAGQPGDYSYAMAA